ncbi:MAG TPA: hypothetical protein VM580_28860 [Labilithrix sp.]|nr:hypothetical protein [Labilithrix sp.]
MNAWRNMRPSRLALMTSFVLLGCGSSERTSRDARITIDASGAELLVGARKASLPAGDVDTEAPLVMQDDAGRRLAYRTKNDLARVVYVVGDGLFVGPLVAQPVDFRAVPHLEHSLGPLFEAAGPRRSELVREVRRERGESGIVRLLVDGSYVDDPAWEQARTQLSPKGEIALVDAMASGLEPGKTSIQLRRAVEVVDIRAPERAALVALRAKERAGETKEPRAVAALLRAVIANDKEKAAEIGCEVLATMTAGGGAGERASLFEAATLAIAAAGATCVDPKLLEYALGGGCVASVRCNDAGPLSSSDASKEDEPLCTQGDVTKAMAVELARGTREVLEASSARPALFAYASLLAKGRLPAAFVTGHERRRYALTQVAEPACDAGLAPGTPCHCDEAALRHFVCQQPTASKVQGGVCLFDVDDEKKTISNVVSASAR